MDGIISNRRTFWFIIAYVIFLSYSFLGDGNQMGLIAKKMTGASIGILVVLFATSLRDFNLQEIVKLCLFLLLSILIASKTGDYILFKLFLFTLGFKQIDFLKCLRCDIWARFFLIVFILFLYKFGLAGDVLSSHGDTIRHSFGFSNPNTLGIAVFILSMEIIVVYGEKSSCRAMLLALILSVLASIATDSRTAFLATIVFLILYQTNRWVPHFYKSSFFSGFACCIPILIAGSTYFATKGYINGNNFAITLNDILSSRLERNVIFYAKYKLSLFGNQVGLLEMSLDNAYAYLLIGVGIVGTILFIVAYIVTIRKLILSGNMLICFSLLCFALVGFGERLWMYVDYNIFMLMFSSCLIFSDENNSILYENSNIIDLSC